MKLQEEIKHYIPYNEQEEKDKEVMIDFIKTSKNIFLRKNKIAHFTASSWLVNKEHTKILMIFHNIYNSWSWTGGHADGDEDLLRVAVKEAKEETGIEHIFPVSDQIFSLEIITVDGHKKRGEYVPSHLHVNITYLLEADELDLLQIKTDENSGVKWFPIESVVEASNEPWMRGIYRKLNDKLIRSNAIAYLEKNPLLHMGMLEPIRRNHADILYANAEGVFLFERKSGAYMLSTENEDLAKQLICSIDKAALFSLHQSSHVDFVKERFGFQESLDCVQAVYTKKEQISVDSECMIRPLEKKDAIFVKEHYHTSDDISYFETLIAKGDLYGAYIGNELTGFIGQHLEGSMGLLEVLPAYKRRGIGKALESFLINEILRMGNVPFCQVVEGNAASMYLQMSLGMEVSKDHLYWLF